MTPLVIAHRGASAYAPENTLASLRLALEQGADGVEFDVRLSRDSVPVVIHDASLKRLAGIAAKVEDLTSAQLGSIDVGSGFKPRHPRRFKPEYSSQGVPTLAMVMQLLEGFDGLIYVELKCGRTFVPLVEAVTALLKRTHQRIIVKSFRLPALAEVRRRLPDMETAALFEPTIVVRHRRYIDRAREFGATQLSLHRSLATPKLAGLAHRANMPMTVWTVDDPKWIGRARNLGIKALITNDPARMLKARDEDS